MGRRFGEGGFELPTRCLEGNARQAVGSKGLEFTRKHWPGDGRVYSIQAGVKAKSGEEVSLGSHPPGAQRQLAQQNLRELDSMGGKMIKSSLHCLNTFHILF